MAKAKNSLSFTGEQGHQGDVQFYKIAGIPKEAKPIQKQFIAASERSGSFHALFGNYDQYEVEGGVVIDAKEDLIMNHSLQSELAGMSMDEARVLPKKDHRHTTLAKGVYFFGIQRRFNPLEGYMQNVRD